MGGPGPGLTGDLWKRAATDTARGFRGAIGRAGSGLFAGSLRAPCAGGDAGEGSRGLSSAPRKPMPPKSASLPRLEQAEGTVGRPPKAQRLQPRP